MSFEHGFADGAQGWEARFAEMWSAGGFQNVPVAYPNRRFIPPDPPTEHVALHILPGQGERLSIGNPALFGFPGVVQATIYAPIGTGSRRAGEIADECARIFSEARFTFATSGYVRAEVAGLVYQGVSGPYCQFVLSCNFVRDVITEVNP